MCERAYIMCSVAVISFLCTLPSFAEDSSVKTLPNSQVDQYNYTPPAKPSDPKESGGVGGELSSHESDVDTNIPPDDHGNIIDNPTIIDLGVRGNTASCGSTTSYLPPTGEIDYPGDIDFFTFDLSHSTDVEIRTQGAKDIYTKGVLYDSSKRVVAEAKYGGGRG